MSKPLQSDTELFVWDACTYCGDIFKTAQDEWERRLADGWRKLDTCRGCGDIISMVRV